MPSLSSVAYYCWHVQELRSIIQWNTWHNPVHERDEMQETPTQKKCFHFLDLTSRSFASVIQELHPELLFPMTCFYLILRGLDTIEDDMGISIEEKEPLLRNFYKSIDDENFTYNGNSPGEKDRQLLVEFDNITKEFANIKDSYKTIIRDITKRMGNGMADYAKDSGHNEKGVQTIKDYELYCHYVAGLVGEGCTRLFVEAKLANPALLQRPELMESMGQLLQQTNIIRDIHEDKVDKRSFWPREIWSKHVDEFDDLFKAENKEKALNCLNEMVLNALKRADECLFYMAGVKEQSVFNFVAIPQSMAIATLELCFQNPAVFERNVKITKGNACQLMMESTQNLQLVCDVFRRYARKIHKRNRTTDPSFLEISIACGRIEQFIESVFPSQTAKTVTEGQGASGREAVEATVQQANVDPDEEERKRKAAEADKIETYYVMGAVLFTLLLVSAIMIGTAWFFGARFDKIFEEFSMSSIFPPNKDIKEALSGKPSASPSAYEGGHEEL